MLSGFDSICILCRVKAVVRLCACWIIIVGIVAVTFKVNAVAVRIHLDFFGIHSLICPTYVGARPDAKMLGSSKGALVVDR